MRRRQLTLRRALLLLTYTISTLLSLSPGLSVHAQTYQPALTVQSGSAFVDGKGLYVTSGGTVAGMVAQQTFMIDLSVSWNTTSPAYKQLATGPAANWFPSTMSADGLKWFIFMTGIGTGYAYDVQAGTWNIVFQYPAAAKVVGFFGRRATTDPETGLIYIPFGYQMPDSTWGMGVVDLDKKTFTGGNDFNFAVPDDNSYTVTWIPALKSLLYVWGNNMFTYNPTTGWKAFVGPTGFTAEEGFCLVTSSSGSKVVLFGGYSASLNASVGDTFIYDVPTLTWKKGASSPARDVRRDAACAISNDQLIVWGGDTGNWQYILPAEHLTIVYDLKTDKWVSNYVAPTASPRTTNPSGNTTPSTSPTSSTSQDGAQGISRSTAITIGAIGGVLAFGFMLGGMFIYRARMGRTKSSPPPPSAPANTVHSNTQPYDDKDPGNGGDSNKRTVQEGHLGSSPITQGPHTYSDEIPPQNPYEGVYAAQPMVYTTQPMSYPQPTTYAQPMAYVQPMAYTPQAMAYTPQALAYTPQPMVYTDQPMVWSHPQDLKERGIMTGGYVEEPPRNPHT